MAEMVSRLSLFQVHVSNLFKHSSRGLINCSGARYVVAVVLETVVVALERESTGI